MIINIGGDRIVGTGGAGAVTPAWYRAAAPAVNSWTELTGTNINALETAAWRAMGGCSAMVSDWNGACMDTRDSTVRKAAAGGHGNYAGTQAIALRLKNDVLAWTEEHATAVPSDIVADADRFLNGDPNTRHTYYSTQYIESLNRLMLFGGAALYPGISSNKEVVGFNHAAGTYDAVSTYADLTAFNSFDGSVGKDPATENVYIWSNHLLYKWRAASQTSVGVITDIFSEAVSGGFLCADSRRNQMLYAGGTASAYKPSLINLSTDAITVTTLSGANAANIDGTGLGVGFHLDAVAANDCYLVRTAASGGTVYRINAATLSVDTLTTTGGSGIPACVTGPYNRFLPTGDLGGGVYGFLLCPTYTDNCWFLRTK